MEPLVELWSSWRILMAPSIVPRWLDMALNHTRLKALKSADKPYKVTDRDSLYIEVLVSGVMTWRFQYDLNGKREKVTFGRYPELGLADARKISDAAGALVAIGQSPAKDKQVKKTDHLAERWIAANSLSKKPPFPGFRGISQIDPELSFDFLIADSPGGKAGISEKLQNSAVDGEVNSDAWSERLRSCRRIQNSTSEASAGGESSR